MHGHGTTSTTNAGDARSGDAPPLPRLDRLVGLSDDELLRLASANPGVRLERTRNGGLIVMTPSGSETGGWNFRVAGQFYLWLERSGLGEGFDSSAGFSLPDGSMKAADLAFVRQDRWDTLTADQRERYAPLAPDFVVELVSPSDSLPDQKAKMQEWIANGVRLGWLIDPGSRTVWIYRASADAPEQLDNPATVTGDDDVLPGFVLDLSRVFG